MIAYNNAAPLKHTMCHKKLFFGLCCVICNMDASSCLIINHFLWDKQLPHLLRDQVKESKQSGLIYQGWLMHSFNGLRHSAERSALANHHQSNFVFSSSYFTSSCLLVSSFSYLPLLVVLIPLFHAAATAAAAAAFSSSFSISFSIFFLPSSSSAHR